MWVRVPPLAPNNSTFSHPYFSGYPKLVLLLAHLTNGTTLKLDFVTVTQLSMRILLQHVRTQLFLKSLGNWTANPYEAFDFEHSQRAIEFAEKNQLQGIQILVKFIDSQFDEAVPLPIVPATTSHKPR